MTGTGIIKVINKLRRERMTMKKIISYLAAAAMTASMIPQAIAANDDITVMINNEKLVIKEGDTKPFVENDRTLVPMRAIFEKLGASVEWDDATKTVTSYDTDQNITIIMQVGSNVYSVNGEELKLDVPAQIVNGRTVVPLSAVAEGLNATVNWDGGTRTINITSDKNIEAAYVSDNTDTAAEETLPDGIYASIQHETASPEWVTKLPSAQDKNTKQLFVVAGLGMDKTTATISMHERDKDGNWKQILSTPGYVGKNGLCADEDHKEGCGQTPTGVFRFNKAFGIAADPGCTAFDYVKVTNDTYWSGDDKEGMHYNEMVDIKDFPNLDMENSEHIVDYEYQYQYCLNISFNEDGTPGRGSAIFLHCFGPTKPYTGGCVALPENIMKMVMQRVQTDCVVVIDTLDNLGGTL